VVAPSVKFWFWCRSSYLAVLVIYKNIHDQKIMTVESGS
jgi:hypothetical protein